jgi:hypothetical protein
MGRGFPFFISLTQPNMSGFWKWHMGFPWGHGFSDTCWTQQVSLDKGAGMAPLDGVDESLLSTAQVIKRQPWV